MTKSTSSISPAAIIHPTAKIAENVVIGPCVYIGEHVTIGEGTRIDAHAVISKHSIIGKNNYIHSHAAVGGDPQDISYRGEEVWLTIGDDNIIREFVTINRGSVSGGGMTYVGNKNYFLSYSHVAHDAHVGNEILFINYASIGGHVTVDDFAIMGAYSTAHQFCHIGSYSFLAHNAQISQDIPPFMLVKGIPGAPCALNLVGLRRRGFSQETISGLKKAFRLMYRQGLTMEEVESGLIELSKETPEVQMIIDLMKKSKRGIVRRQSRE